MAVPLEVESIYTVAPAENVDAYINGDVLASVTDSNGSIINAVLASGTLPAGVTLNSSNGAITVNNASLMAPGTTSFPVVP